MMQPLTGSVRPDMRMQNIDPDNKYLLWWSPAIAYTAVIIAMAAMQMTWRLPGGQTDKLVHLLLYGVLSCLVYLPLSRRGQRTPFLRTIVLCMAIGVLDESIQHFNPSRTSSLGDLLADLAGSFSGAALCSLLMHTSRDE